MVWFGFTMAGSLIAWSQDAPQYPLMVISIITVFYLNQRDVQQAFGGKQVDAALLRSVPGVGPVLAATLLAEFPELGRLSGKQAAALAGVAPFTRQSGRWRGQARIAGGRASVRAALYMGALVASRHHPHLAPVYRRLLAAGKPKKLALVAVMRKLLVQLNALRRDHRPFQEDYRAHTP